jgi:hypothetical protein
MPDYLVCSSDTAVTKSDYRIVAADSPSAALEVFNRRIVAYDRVFRNSVLDLAMNMSFVERFYLATPQENYHFNETASASVNDVTVKARASFLMRTRNTGRLLSLTWTTTIRAT